MSGITPELRAEMRASAAKSDREWEWYREHVPLLLDALEAVEAQRDDGRALLAQALANNPIRRDLIVRAYALLKGLETP